MQAESAEHLETIAPFLRWAGGKRWLVSRLPTLLGSLPVKNYHEPFLGGASMFFGIKPSGEVYLSDLNEDLIEAYIAIRDNPGKVWQALNKHINTSDHYYHTRSRTPSDPIKRAARFLFLNHTSFNGIYRVNRKGEYNVPYGNRPTPTFPDLIHLLEASDRLAGTHIEVGDFATCTTRVRKGDLVFLDPPYTVAHNNNGFVRYNQKLFSFDDQRRLAKVVDQIRKKNAFYILTNAAHSSISDLFDRNERKLEVTRRNSIGGKSAKRGSAAEYLFTNLPVQ